jgi:hypothetical protein
LTTLQPRRRRRVGATSLASQATVCNDTEGSMPKTKRILVGLFALDVCLFALSGIPAFKNAKHGIKDAIGGIGWFGFLLTTLVLVVFSAVLLVRRGITGRTAA